MAALDLCLFDVDGRLRERCCSFFDTRLDVGFPIEVRNGRSGSGSIKMEGLRRAAQFFEREPAGCHQCEQDCLSLVSMPKEWEGPFWDPILEPADGNRTPIRASCKAGRDRL